MLFRPLELCADLTLQSALCIEMKEMFVSLIVMTSHNGSTSVLK